MLTCIVLQLTSCIIQMILFNGDTLVLSNQMINFRLLYVVASLHLYFLVLKIGRISTVKHTKQICADFWVVLLNNILSLQNLIPLALWFNDLQCWSPLLPLKASAPTLLFFFFFPHGSISNYKSSASSFWCVQWLCLVNSSVFLALPVVFKSISESKLYF